VGRKMRTESLELGSMWRSFNLTSYATEKAGLPGAVASPGQKERVADGCGEMVREGDDLLCGRRGLGSGGVVGMGIGMGGDHDRKRHRRGGEATGGCRTWRRDGDGGIGRHCCGGKGEHTGRRMLRRSQIRRRKSVARPSQT
jgi:hypothetical protein